MRSIEKHFCQVWSPTPFLGVRSDFYVTEYGRNNMHSKLHLFYQSTLVFMIYNIIEFQKRAAMYFAYTYFCFPNLFTIGLKATNCVMHIK